MRRCARFVSQRCFTTAPASPAPPAAAAPAKAGEQSDLAFIARASSGVLAFGIPWWLLTQVRDDAAFRGWLEDEYPAVLRGLRAACPQYVPEDRARCYRQCQLPEGPEAEGSGSGGGGGGGFTPTPLGLRTALGSLETADSLQREVLPRARAQWAAAAARAAAAAALAASGEATALYVTAMQAEEASAARELAHLQATAQGWAAGAPRHAWRPPPPPPPPARKPAAPQDSAGSASSASSNGAGGSSSSSSSGGGGGGSWWALWGAKDAADYAGESSLAVAGGDEDRPSLWRGARPAVRAALPLEEALVMGERLALVKSGEGTLWAEAQEAVRLRPPPPQEPAPPPEPPFYEAAVESVRAFLFGEAAGEAMPPLAEEAAAGGAAPEVAGGAAPEAAAVA